MKNSGISDLYFLTILQFFQVLLQVHLADRTLMPGDVVRRMIKGKDTQRGYCRDIELNACVQVIGTKQVLTNIKSEDLVPLEVLT